MNVATKWKYDFYFGVYNKLFGLKGVGRDLWTSLENSKQSS